MTVFERILIFWLSCVTLLFAQTPPVSDINLSDTIPIAPEITTGTFSNGLRYYIRKNSKPENRAQLHLIVNAGSVLENDDQQGLAHFCEHMAFNGTKHFAKQELIDYLESIGMKFGPEINAYTSFDETVYMLQVPTDNADVLEKAFQILEDWARFVSYDDEEIDKERGVIIEEWRLGRGADSRMFDKHLPVLFKDSRYATRLPIGKKAVLDTFKHQTLKDFYHDWYRPDLMAVVAVGDFDPQSIKQLISKHFENMPPAKNPRVRRVYPVPDHQKPLFTIATDPEATRNILRLYFLHDLLPQNTVADYRRGFVENIYNIMLNARLQEIAQQADPPFLYAFSSDGRMVRTKGSYYLGAIVKENGFLPGLKALLTESNRVHQFGFTETELARAKMDLMRSMEQYYKEKDKTESVTFAREYTRNFLMQEPIPGIDYEYELAVQYIDGIQLDEVNQISGEWLIDHNRVVRVDAPDKEGVAVPDESEFETVFDQVDQQKIEPYVDQVTDTPLVENPPSPGSVVSETEIPELGVTVLKLSNGITVYCKPTDFQNDEIRFNGYSIGGDGGVGEADYIPAVTATSVVTEGGVGNFDLIELQKKLAGKVVNVQPWIGTVSEGISGGGSPDDIETMFQLIYLYMTSPRKDSTAFLAYLDKMRGALENRNARPETAYQDTLQLIVGNYSYRAQPWSLELLKDMDLDKSMEFYRQCFADLDDMNFFFVGNLDMSKIKELAVQYLATLPSLPGTETWTDPGIVTPNGIIEKDVYKGVEPKSLVSLVFHGKFDWSKENQYQLAAMADMLRIKLRQVVREDLGGTYGVRVSPASARIPEQEYKLTISFGCRPDRVDELKTAIFEQIDSLKADGPSEELMLKIRETDLRELEVNLKENAYWLSNLFSYHMDQLPLTQMLDYKSRVESLTPQDVQKTAQKLIDFNNYIQVTLYPEDFKKE